MDLLKLFKKVKMSAPMEFEKPDIAYQVWELGRVFGCIAACLKQSKMNDLKQQITYLNILLKRLGKEGAKVIGDSPEMDEFISYFLSLESPDSDQDIEPIQLKLEQWKNLITHELRASSMHLCNIFSCCYGLKTMQFKLINELQSIEIADVVGESIGNLEKLEKGDKVLTSPNLQISSLNLKIIKFRLNEAKKHLDIIRKREKTEHELIEKIVNERAEFIESLILDLKNPTDYIGIVRKFYNNLVPFFICYYLIAIPLVFIFSPDVINKINSITSSPLYSKVIVLLITTSIVPAYLSFLWWTFHSIRDKMIISSFKFKRKQYFKK